MTVKLPLLVEEFPFFTQLTAEGLPLTDEQLVDGLVLLLLQSDELLVCFQLVFYCTDFLSEIGKDCFDIVKLSLFLCDSFLIILGKTFKLALFVSFQ